MVLLIGRYDWNPTTSCECVGIGMVLLIGPYGWNPGTSWAWADIGMVLPIDGGIEVFRILL